MPIGGSWLRHIITGVLLILVLAPWVVVRPYWLALLGASLSWFAIAAIAALLCQTFIPNKAQVEEYQYAVKDQHGQEHIAFYEWKRKFFCASCLSKHQFEFKDLTIHWAQSLEPGLKIVCNDCGKAPNDR